MRSWAKEFQQLQSLAYNSITTEGSQDCSLNSSPDVAGSGEPFRARAGECRGFCESGTRVPSNRLSRPGCPPHALPEDADWSVQEVFKTRAQDEIHSQAALDEAEQDSMRSTFLKLTIRCEQLVLARCVRSCEA